MKFCYLDETGPDQHSPIVILVGVIVDIQRMNLAKQEWKGLFEKISNLARKPIIEIHARDLISGSKAWHGVEPATRFQAVDTILDWISGRKHKITFASVDKARFRSPPNDDERKQALKNEWITVAFHIALSLQKDHQKEQRNKGNTLLIFDKGREPDKLIDLLTEPPSWSDTYYNWQEKKDRLDKIIDVPFYADSHHVPLIQIADLICYILRRYSELKDYGKDKKYEGELTRYEGWVEKIKECCIDKRHRYKKKLACDTSKFFTELAPPSLREL